MTDERLNEIEAYAAEHIDTVGEAYVRELTAEVRRLRKEVEDMDEGIIVTDRIGIRDTEMFPIHIKLPPIG